MKSLATEAWFLIGLFCIACLLIAFTGIVGEVAEGDVKAFDQTILLYFRQLGDISQPIGPPWAKELARDVTALGSYVVLNILVVAVVTYLVLLKQRAAAYWILSAAIGGTVLSNVLKWFFERDRPDLSMHATQVFTSGFPSGHATLSAIIYLTLAALLSSLHSSLRMKAYFLCWALVLVILIGVSRVYLGVHYPTDVLAGWCVGAAWAGFCWLGFVSFHRNLDEVSRTGSLP
jgi:undecaprenyl-diphosphatase